MLFLCIAADASIGRFDRNSLSDQTLMELFVEDLPEKEKYRLQDEEDDFKDIAHWEMVKLNDFHRVTSIQTERELGGSLNFAYVPPLCLEIVAESASLLGTIETSALPDGLQLLSIRNNSLRGTFGFERLPQQMKYVDIYQNDFSGSAVLDNLPAALEDLDLSFNNFDGTVSLDLLPQTLQTLNMSQNPLTGAFILRSPPASLDALWADNCAFSGTAVVHSQVKDIVFLWRNHIEETVDERGVAYDESA